MANQTLTALDGFRVGHAQDFDGLTGCTVILCPPKTIGGVDQRGGAPGTRETDLLHPMHMVEHVHALLLAGGSAYGLDAAGGVMRYLEEQSVGFNVGVGIVPIVPAAVIFDLDIGLPTVRPDAAMGYVACQNASDQPVEQGCVGVGTGAQVGRLLGPDFKCKAGAGSAVIDLGEGLLVGALFAVNAFGDVIGDDGQILAGVRQPPEGNTFANALNLLPAMVRLDMRGSNTVIGVVATTAQLSKEDTNKVAQMAQDGLARAIRPAHTMLDGDTFFALASGTAGTANVSVIGAFAAEATALAIRRAALNATSLGGVPAGKTVGNRIE